MRIWFVSLSLLSLLLASCGGDISPGSKFAGQTCFVDDDCRSGLICVSRVCTPNGADVTPASDAGTADDMGDMGADGGTEPDMPLPPNNDPGCEVGTQSCVSDTRRAECVATDDGTQTFEFACPRGTACSAGRCEGDAMCEDLDGDGYGENCAAGPDCEDRVGAINPGAQELCETPFDDNCNGELNEGCMQSQCCPGGCPDTEFCSSTCVCQAFEPDVCEYQNQPCAQEGIFSNGLYCAPLGDQLRCVGICQLQADNPDATCPEANSVCAFGEGQQGICLSGCDPNVGCGEPGLGCLPVSSSPLGGMCVPVNDANGAGDNCNPDAFFDCGQGLLCIDRTGSGNGTCEQACRPFGTTTSDCAGSNYCLPLSNDIGLCFADNGQSEGDRCRPQGSTCSDDAVGCYPSGMGGARCQRVCRLDQGAGDCPTGNCRQFDPQQTELGVCRTGPL